MNKIEEIKDRYSFGYSNTFIDEVERITTELQPFLKTPKEELLAELGELISEQQHTGDWQFNDNADVRKFTEICNKVKELENGN